ncbi:succinyl-diaminopimelate desuccinylase [soil metagenome]
MPDTTTPNPTLDLVETLIARPSVTPDDKGCQALIAARLEALGFACRWLESNGVTNLWARHGTTRPIVAFAGHTDVVPTGPADAWQSAPFEPSRRDGKLYGRGAADMKSSVAAFVVAAEEYVSANPGHAGSVALLLTSDEEGPALDGTVKVCADLKSRDEAPDYCIVGEPTSAERFGDTIKNGRRGTLSGKLTVHGVQGHVAYPQLARNPVHELAPVLAQLVAEQWDEGNASFPPTTFQISNIHAGTGVGNVIPGKCEVMFNLRFGTESTPESLQGRVAAFIEAVGLDATIDWTLGGLPFLTADGALSEALSKAILGQTGVKTQLSTTGGTSDGRFIAQICPQVIEFGPINASIHKIDEHVAMDCIEPLKNIYRAALADLLARPAPARS